MKKIISLLIIALFLLISTIGTSLPVENVGNYYIDGNLIFLYNYGGSFNNKKYHQMVQMHESNKEPSYQEAEIITNPESNYIVLMDSAWPMKCHDNEHSGRSPFNTAINNGAEHWNFSTSGFIEGGVVVDNDGNIYFGSFNTFLYALYPNGTLKWRFDTHNLIWSTPTIDEDGTIYIGSYDGYLYSINSEGTLNWRFKAGSFSSISSSPAIDDEGIIYFGVMGPEDIGRVYAINKDGVEKWHYDTDYWITSDPAIGDDGTIYIGSGDNYFYAINPDGTLKWSYKTDNYVKGPPSIGSDGTVYIGSFDGYLYALYPDGNLKWRTSIGFGSETNPSIGLDGTIYIGGEYLWAINPNDGSIKWTLDLGPDRFIHQSSPAISADGIIYIGTNIGDVDGGEIVAINSDGTERWRHMIANCWVDSSPCISENGIVYIGSSSVVDADSYGYLYAFGPGDANNPPNKPSISGPNNGKSGESYSYVISAIDPDIDDLSYYIEWGDGTNTDWIGPNPSGDEITVSHTWSFSGTYTIKAKAKDDEGSESTYATLQVTMPKNKAYYFSISKWLQAHFPLLENLFF